MAMDPKLRARLEQERKQDAQMVKGIFKNYECPGGALRFSFKKYKEDPIQDYELHDGRVHTIPRGVAKHLNNNCWYPEYEYIKGEQTQNIEYGIKTKIKRFGFQSLEFMDLEDQSDASKQKAIIEAVKL